MAAEQRVVELVIDASRAEAGARRAEMAYEHLGDRAAAATAKATASFERQQQLFSSRLPQSIDRVADAFDNLRGKGDPVVTAQLRLEREMTRSLDVINRAVLTGYASEQQASAELARIRARQVVELDEIRLAHDAVAAAAKRQAAEYAQLAAAARQSQAADRSQIAFNSQLGVVPASSGDARASASVFEEQFREMQATARRMEEISMLRSQQVGSNFLQDLNGRFGIGQQVNPARASAAVFEEAAREADDLAEKVALLRSELNPTQAAQDRLNAELEQYNLLAERAGLSAKELAQAQAMARARFDASIPGQGAANDNGAQSRRQSLIYQGFDIGQGVAGGMPIGLIAAQQLPQIAQNYVGQGGLKAAAADVATLASGALAAIGPVGAAFGVAGGAALAYYALTKRETKTTEELLKAHQESIRGVAALWGDAAEQRSRYGRSSTDTVTLGLDNNISALTKRLRENVESGSVGSGISSAINLNRDETGLSGRQFRESSIFKVLQLDFDALHKATAAGRPDILGLIGRLQDIQRTTDNSGIRKMAGDAIDALQPFRDLAEALREAEMERRRLFEDRGENGRLLSRGTTNTRDMSTYAGFLSGEEIAARRSREAFDAEISALNARSPQQRADAARQAASAQYNNDETAAARRLRIEQAGTLALAQSEKTLADAREARAVTLSRVVTDQQLEIQLVGKTAGEAAALRREYELLNQLKDEARQNGGIVDPNEVERIRQTAAEVGKLTEQLATLRLQQDLQFERDQIFRSEREQNVASRMQSAVGYVDLSSEIAAGIRMNELLREQKDAWEDIRDVGRDAIDEVVDSFGQGFNNVGDMARNVLGSVQRMFIDLAVKNPLKNAIYGDNLPTMDSVGGIGGIFSALTGGKFPGADAAGKTVGAMSVTAGSVVVNGGGLGDPASVTRMFAPANSNDPVKAIADAATKGDIVFKGAGNPLGFVGNYKSGVDPRLTDILTSAAQRMPGYQVDAMSGYRAGDPRFHGKGLATDVQLTELLTGRKLGNYQDAASFGTYERYAQLARQVQMEKYPELADDFRWGGYFGGGRGKYGAVDTMHFDLGGRRVGMGGGSWEGGLNSAQRALWPEATSRGMENAAQAIDKMTTSSVAATQGLGQFGGGLGQFSQQLMNAANGMNSPSGGGFLGGLGSLFGGVSPTSSFWRPNTTLGGFLANGFSGGGYTGPGGINDPRGIVHAGEVVWNQSDVARAGGVAAAEAMRRGGVMPAPRISANTNVPGNRIGNRQIVINNAPPDTVVEAEEDEYGNEKINVTVGRVTAQEAARRGSPLHKQLRRMGAKQRPKPR